MNQNNKYNYQGGDLNLLIPNIDTTTERLSSDNTPGIFFKNSLTEKNLANHKFLPTKTNSTEKKIQKNSNNLIPKTIRTTPNNYSNSKNNHSSQKETREMTQVKTNLNSKTKPNKSLINNDKTKNYKTIVKKINMMSCERNKKINENNKIPIRPKKIISNMNDVENKDSYLYLSKLKKQYSLNKLRDENSTSIQTQVYNNRNKSSKDNNINEKNLTLNNFYPNTKTENKNFSISPSSPIIRKKIHNNSSHKILTSDKNINNKYNTNQQKNCNRNISSSHLNNQIKLPNNNIINVNDIEKYSKIIDIRKKFNDTFKYFYKNDHNYNNKLIRNFTENSTFKKINNYNYNKTKKNNNDNLYTTSDYSTINSYWNKRGKDTIQKIAQIKNNLFQKEENEIQPIPKINKKSKELANNSDKYNIEFNNIYDRLFYINNLNLNLNIDGQNQKDRTYF